MAHDPNKIAGFFRQILIITWKNLMLYKQNISGLICEIVFSCLFTLIFVLLVYYSNPRHLDKRNMNPQNVIAYMQSKDFINTTDFYYHPNNEFTHKIIENSYKMLKENIWPLDLKLIGSDESTPEKINETLRNNLFAFVSFTSNLSENSISDLINYTIYTKEFVIF